VQNGLAVIDRLAVDGLCHEDTWWRSAGDGYAPTAPAETAAIVSALRRQRARGLVVLTLDYTEHDAPEAELVAARSRAEGFVPAVSLLALDRAPHGPAATR
jgi:endo-alpha-1,4-polygalactosaminidase (GH114 family)